MMARNSSSGARQVTPPRSESKLSRFYSKRNPAIRIGTFGANHRPMDSGYECESERCLALRACRSPGPVLRPDDPFRHSMGRRDALVEVEVGDNVDVSTSGGDPSPPDVDIVRPATYPHETEVSPALATDEVVFLEASFDGHDTLSRCSLRLVGSTHEWRLAEAGGSFGAAPDPKDRGPGERPRAVPFPARRRSRGEKGQVGPRNQAIPRRRV